MPSSSPLPGLSVLGSLLLCALPANAQADATLFPPHTVLPDGTLVALSANLAWDDNHYNRDPAVEQHADDWRRQEVGVVIRKPDLFDVQIFKDVHNDMWLGVVLGIPTRSFLAPGKSGRLEIGNIKLAAGLEGIAPTRHMPFMESAAATQVFHPMVRGGVNWTQSGKDWLLDIGAFGRDIDGFYQGDTQLVRAAWTPSDTQGRQAHLGLSLSRDRPRQGLQDGTARWASRGVASLLPDRLADSGLLTGVDAIHRQNLQLMLVDGPFWLQGEYFSQQTKRHQTLPTYHGHGSYLSAGWVINAPSRRLVQGMLMQPAVANGRMGVELTGRIGQVDLDDAGLQGGRLTEWTVGANAYLGAHIKLQANLSQTHLERGGTHLHSRAVQWRAQFFF